MASQAQHQSIDLSDNANMSHSTERFLQQATHTVIPRVTESGLVGSNRCIVKSVVVQQQNQSLIQLLLPMDHIIDPDMSGIPGGSSSVCLTLQGLQQRFNDTDIKGVPAIPNWMDLPCLVDNALKQHHTLLLDTCDANNHIEIQSEAFFDLLGDAKWASLSSVAPTVPSNPNQDEAHIIESVKMFTERRIRQRLEDTLDLPPVPSTAQKIIKLRGNPDSDIEELSQVIESDPSLAAQVVSWASSPYYRAPGKVSSVHDAIVRVLGFDMVMNMALGLTLGRCFSERVLNKHDIDRYLANALVSASSTEALTRCIPAETRPIAGIAYLSGLLSNFGQLVLAEIFPVYLQQINRVANANPQLHPDIVELHVLGISGSQVGSWLLEHWSMPDEVVTAVRQQNNFDYSGSHHEYAKLVGCAKYLVSKHQSPSTLRFDIPVSVYQSLNLDPNAAVEKIAHLVAIEQEPSSTSANMSSGSKP